MADPVSKPANTKPAATPPPDWSITVEAYRVGTYPQPYAKGGFANGWMRQPGDQFLLKDAKAFSSVWMMLPGGVPGHEIDECGNPVDASGKPVEFAEGHGPVHVSPEGTPMTTIRNQVKDPMSVMNDLAAANKQPHRGR